MKAKSAGNNIAGFSTLEIVIALALMIVVIVGAVDANIASQYWSLTSQTAQEALYKAKTMIEELRASSAADFQSAITTNKVRSENPDDPTDASCLSGGLCYYIQSKVTDISSCSKYVEADVTWRLAERYATTSAELYTNLTNNDEIIARGGDCVLNTPQGDWLGGTPQESGSDSLGASFTTGIDVLQRKVYLTSSSTPQFKIYDAPTTAGQNPTLLGSTAGKGWRLNAVDAIRDLSTGRTYAYATQHASTSQLAVFDVTDASAPVFVSERTLSGVDKTGSYPEGWRVFVYGNRAYVTTRETTGPELHIFNINAPTQPSEVATGAIELNRTVNDVAVREQIIDGVLHRFLFLASDSNQKELGVFDVTNDNPVEITSVDLTGSSDGLSLYVTGNRLYLGRQSGSEPELYAFDVLDLVHGGTSVVASSEVGASVTTLRGAGDLLFLGTSKTGEEFQVWRSDVGTWNPNTSNAGRTSYVSMPRLSPLGIDIGNDFLFSNSQSVSQSEFLKVMYIP